MTKDLKNNDSQWNLRGTILHISCSWIISFIILAPALFNVQWGGYNWGRIVPSPFTGYKKYTYIFFKLINNICRSFNNFYQFKEFVTIIHA